MSLRKAAKDGIAIGSGITLSSVLVLLFDDSEENGKKTKERIATVCDTITTVSTGVGRIIRELPRGSVDSVPAV